MTDLGLQTLGPRLQHTEEEDPMDHHDPATMVLAVVTELAGHPPRQPDPTGLAVDPDVWAAVMYRSDDPRRREET